MLSVQEIGGFLKSNDWTNEAKVWPMPVVLPTRCEETGCHGKLVKNGGYRRQVCVSCCGWIKTFRVQRMRCKVCGKTMAVLPLFLAPYQRVVTGVRQTLACVWALG